MNLKVNDFPNKKYICKKHEGDNVSPVISWNKILKAKSYAIIMEDPDAVGGTFIHWYIPYISNNINKIDSLCFIDRIKVNDVLHLLTIQTPIFIKIKYIFIQYMSYIFFYVISFYCIIFFYHMNLLIFYNKKL